MGICQSTPSVISAEITFPEPNQTAIKHIKPSKYHINDQVAVPIGEPPQLLQPVKLALEKLGPFNYDKSDKLICGKEMGPYKFPNDTVYVGQWYVIYYLTRTVNRMEKGNTIFQISRILKALL